MMRRMVKMLIIQHTVIFFLLFLSLLTAKAQPITYTINNGWMFNRSVDSEIQSIPVSLPHTWNTDAYALKNYWRGEAVYRRSLSFEPSWHDKQLFVTFEAASKKAKLFVNDQFVGEHRGGYTAFTFDITPFCSFSSPNTLMVLVDNSDNNVPPVSGDFTFFGGIYRDVWITALPKQHFNMLNHGSSGIFIATTDVSEEKASLNIRAEVRNTAAETSELLLENILYSPQNQKIKSLNRTISLSPGQQSAITENIEDIDKPQLWSPEQPNLYRVETVLRNARTGQLLDRKNHYTGFRWYRFDAQKGFFLNGKPYKLRGVCRHQDQEPIGVALTDEMHRRDMMLIKEMGANFIRISHYPQDAAVLEMCDKMGLLVWEEIPVIDVVPDSEAYAAACETNLREMIRQHYNHPSVILWGYMNEILLVTQRRFKGEELKEAVERAVKLAKRLENVLNEEDTLRTSVMAFHGSNNYNEYGLSSITDVVGWNLYQGWYGGKVDGFDRFVDEQNRNYPEHPMIISEYGAGSDRRIHSLMPKAFDFSIEYQQLYLEHYLPVIENRAFISGGAHWNFIDFSSALRDESMPRINNKGLVYSDRTPKDVYYYFKALWRSDIPVVYIASRDWQSRTGMQEDEQPVLQPVKVYSNLPEVALFVDGKHVGKKKVVNRTAVFEVPFKKGIQFVKAEGKFNKKVVEDGMQIKFNPIPSVLNENNIKGIELAINVGSNCYFTCNRSNLTWVPDRPYEPGGWGYLGSENTKEEGTQAQIDLTDNNPLFQTLRSNITGYRFDVPPGDYELELLFADIYKESENAVYLLGKEGQQPAQANAFQISINNMAVEENFCPACEVGALKAIRRKYMVRVENNRLEIGFGQRINKTFLNGIKLRKL